MSKNVFKDYSRYYDLLYSDKDYVGEADYIRSILVRNGIDGGDILEFGSGTGKHGKLLADMGYLVQGVERSAEMVSQICATENFSCQEGDICTVKMGRNYDAVLSLFHVVSYQVANENIQAVFARAAEHVKVGGLFVFDFWYTPAVYVQKPVVRVKRMADSEVEITRIAEPRLINSENRVDVDYTIYSRDLDTDLIKVFRETHSMRHFSIPEINLLADLNGFKLVCAEEFMTRKEPSVDTWGVCVVLRKA